jgi:hypothetical protein
MFASFSVEPVSALLAAAAVDGEKTLSRLAGFPLALSAPAPVGFRVGQRLG